LLDITLNIVASLILIGAGYLLRNATRTIVHIRLARSWRISARSPVLVYIGVSQSEVEPTGYVGGGDAYALQELGSLFSKVGLAYDIHHLGSTLPEEPADDLILLGGPDGNILTASAYARMNSQIRIVDGHQPYPFYPDISIHDLQTGKRYVPATTHAQRWGGRGAPLGPMSATSDYGVVISAPSPFKDGKRIIAIFGAFGYGTWGAIRWMRNARVSRELLASPNGFECLVPVDVVGGQPIPRSPEILRPIPAIAAQHVDSGQ
jgi:hypothetical protein